MKKKKYAWTEKELKFFKKFKKPVDIQNFLNSIAYDSDNECRSPRYVIKERKAHCFEGALFAAAALRELGYKPLLVDLRAVNDDDHVIAVYKKNNRWGALGKSNFTTLRSREPVYKTIRELSMSYFDFYCNTIGEKTMREYSRPLDLSIFDKNNWMTTDEELEYIGDYLDDTKHTKVLTPAMTRSLEEMDKKLLKSSLMGANFAGLYKPKIKKDNRGC